MNEREREGGDFIRGEGSIGNGSDNDIEQVDGLGTKPTDAEMKIQLFQLEMEERESQRMFEMEKLRLQQQHELEMRR